MTDKMEKEGEAYSPLPHEIPCHGVLIKFSREWVYRFANAKDVSEERAVNEYADRMLEPVKRCVLDPKKFMGIAGTNDGFIVMLRKDVAERSDAQRLVDEYEKIGLTATLLEETCYADSRYQNKKYEGICVPLPPCDLEKGIITLLESKCVDWHVTENRSVAGICYHGDLGLGSKREIVIGVMNSDEELMAGVQGVALRAARGTNAVRANWREILEAVGKDADLILAREPKKKGAQA